MACSFDWKYFDSNSFDVCYDDIYPVGPPFILLKQARGFVFNYSFQGILLKDVKKTLFFTMRLKRRIVMTYVLDGNLLKNQVTSDILFSGINLRKKEMSLNVDQRLLYLDENAHKKIEEQNQELIKIKEILEDLNDFTTLEMI